MVIRMRDIKFRAWEPARFEDGEKYGGKMYYSDKCDEKRMCGFIINTNSGYNNNDFIWMQYTGLKDCQGKEIYEGDIIDDLEPTHGENNRAIVRWSDEEAKFYLDPLDIENSWHDWEMEELNHSRIVTNIHESPELLEVSK